jgi:hypothetical protein
LIKAAVERYGRDRPEDVTEDEAGDDGKYYPVTGLASWVEDFSSVLAIEYPAQAVTADHQPIYLESEDWVDDYWAGSIRYLFLPNHNPASSEVMRIKYTVPYVWSGSGAAESVTIPTQDFYAICNLAAGLCCMAISTKFSRTTDATITADAVSHTTRSNEFSKRAKEYIGMYENHLGLGTTDGKPPFVQGAGAFVDMDTEPGWSGGRDYLFHRRETR